MTNLWLHWCNNLLSALHHPTFSRLLLALVLGACVGANGSGANVPPVFAPILSSASALPHLWTWV